MKFDPKIIEEKILKYWEENKIYEKAKEKNKGNKKFYFLDGPPYTSGHVHVGTAWNKTLKDVILRYKRLNGYDVWDRAGYDMHGLPIENAVANKLNLNSKEDIEKYGVDKFIEECKSFAIENMKSMNNVFKRMAVWMDFKNAYQPIKKEFINGVWWLIKKAYENNRLYPGEKTMTWCPHCQTALAKHELIYKKLKENSIFVKFQLKDKNNEYFIIWTTTPWTICFNLGVMVNPNYDYVKIKVDNEYWYIAKDRLNYLLKEILNKDYEIIDTFKGKKLKGIEYVHPLNKEISLFNDLKKKYPNIHTLVLSEEYVNTDDGTGLVHMAPGCGPEDYEVGHRNNIPPFNEIDEQGIFKESMSVFSGWVAKKDDAKFIEYLKKKGSIVAVVPIEHDYAHCWRCKTPVVFKTTKQWFFKIEDLIEDARSENKKIKWNPKWAGSKWFDSWLKNLRDNSITRQRFWGTPVPIWICDKCNHVEVIGSIKELKEKSINGIPDDLHRPYIDKVELKCPKCGSKMHRIPDILDVWVDSGTASWNSLYYPERKDLFEEYFPADFIVEGKDQIRGWFNLLMITSMVSMHRPSFKSVYMHGFINDALGRKMSKSLKNYITPEEIIEKYGSDLMRYYFVSNSEPGVDLNYNPKDVLIRLRNINVLWNLTEYLINLIELNSNSIDKIVKEIESKGSILNQVDYEEKYILSRLNSTIKKVTKNLDDYDYKIALYEIEDFFLEISRFYVQLIRHKLNKKPNTIIYTLWISITNLLKLLAPFIPMISEELYLRLVKNNDSKKNKESIHLEEWPTANEDLINQELEERFKTIKNIIQIGLKIRDKIGYGVRWPLKEMIIETNNNKVKESITELESILKKQLNIKEIVLTKDGNLAKMDIKWNYQSIASKYKKEVVKIIANLSLMSREAIINHIKLNENFNIVIDDKEYELTPSDFIVEYTINKDYAAEKTDFGFIFIKKEVTPELFIEGFTRELIRRVQQLRKQSKLKKTDEIKLYIGLKEKELIESLKEHMQKIKDTTYSSSIIIDNISKIQDKKVKNSTNFKVKSKEGLIAIDY